jgi:enoyl-CoA hydratase/carnithine racemase
VARRKLAAGGLTHKRGNTRRLAMDEQRVRIELDANGVAEVAMVRGDKMNALDPGMFAALVDAVAQLRGEPRLRAVVLHGEGRAFCAGLDKSSLQGIAAQPGGGVGDLVPRTHGLANAWQQVAWGWRELPVPVIAAVHGVAYGGGLQVALGADVRLVHPEAKLSVMEIRWGLVPDMAGCVLLTELTRADVARELTFTGRVVSGTEAVALGLATRATGDPLGDARAMARQIAASNPDAIRAAKRLFNTATPVDAARVLVTEAFEQQRLIGSRNQREAVAAGLEGRAPVFECGCRVGVRSRATRPAQVGLRECAPQHSPYRTVNRAPPAAFASPITAAWPKPCWRNTASTWSTLSGVQDTSRPPLVCGSVNNAWSASAKPAGSAMSLP